MSVNIDKILTSIPGAEKNYGALNASAEEALEQIEGEFSKRGTLHTQEVNADILQDAAIALLSQAAHLNGYRALATAFSLGDEVTALDLLSRLTRHMLSQPWSDLHPQGSKAQRLRQSWAQEIIQILANIAQKTDVSDAQRGDLTQLSELGADVGLKTDAITSALDKNPMSETTSADGPLQSPVSATDQPASPVADHARALDARGRAKLREDMRALARRVTEHDPDAPVAYLIRSAAAWMESPHCPPHDGNGTLEQPGLSKSLRQEFLSLIDTPSISAVLKLEDRLYLSPDWFEGQAALYDLLGKMGLLSARHAVKTRCVQRLEELPELVELCFPNLEPLVPRQVQLWVKKPQTGTAKIEDSFDTSLPPQEAFSIFNDRLAAASSPRDIAAARLAFAQYCAANEHPSFAALMVDEVVAQSDALSARDWDASFFNALAAFSSATHKD